MHENLVPTMCKLSVWFVCGFMFALSNNPLRQALFYCFTYKRRKNEDKKGLGHAVVVFSVFVCFVVDAAAANRIPERKHGFIWDHSLRRHSTLWRTLYDCLALSMLMGAYVIS